MEGTETVKDTDRFVAMRIKLIASGVGSAGEEDS